MRKRGETGTRGGMRQYPARPAHPATPIPESSMLESIWPRLSTAFRDELILQCVKQMRSSPDEAEALARVVADLIKARPQSVKAQWRLSDTFGTKRAIALDPRRVAPFLGITYMTARKSDLTALYAALGVKHVDLNVDDSSAVGQPPTQAQFAGVLAGGLDGVAAESLLCMVAIIADTGIDAWQSPAREALAAHAAQRS